MFRRYIILSLVLVAALAVEASAQVFTPRLPIYIVNGHRLNEEQVRLIEPEDIVSNELLPANEETIAKYGNDASNGVILITLRYDTSARFEIEGEPTSYSNYIAQQVKWSSLDGVARVVIAFTVNPDGTVSEEEVLESTDRKLLNRIRKAIEEAPRWVAAKKDGKGITTRHILRITLPLGREMPRESYVIII